jgi:S-adenosylmethionine:tRNA ribosyltransferase-isomerase
MKLSYVLTEYDYDLPPALIAKKPASPRDSARLMIYNRADSSVKFDVFSKIIEYLPKDCVLVFNQTKVIPAKFELKKTTGGTVPALLIETRKNEIVVLASGSLKPDEILKWGNRCSFKVMCRTEREAVLKPSTCIKAFQILLNKYGQTPLPPYLKDSPLSENRRRKEYQTIFAKDNGSVAAPTAGLHFTKDLIKKIIQAGHEIEYVTLHVNLGTFAPLTDKQMKTGKLHLEHFSIDKSTIARLNDAKKLGRPIVAIGTTTVRTLESASEGKSLKRLSGSTDLFITENYKPHFVDHLITNFHVPKSSLMMLVSAFTGRQKLINLYKQAIDERIRFFSFGDGMMII